MYIPTTKLYMPTQTKFDGITCNHFVQCFISISPKRVRNIICLL